MTSIAITMETPDILGKLRGIQPRPIFLAMREYSKRLHIQYVSDNDITRQASLNARRALVAAVNADLADRAAADRLRSAR